MKNFSSTVEECPNSKSHSEFDRCRSTRSFSRQPSLADIPSIASNCGSSPIMTRGKDSVMNRESRSEALDSEIARTENSIALLAAQSSNVQYKYLSLVEPATPPKPAKNQDQNAQQSTSDEPLTPTANLKMLVSAASPAIRDRESKKRELFTDSGESEPPSPNPCVVPSFALPIFDSKVVFRDGNFVHLNPQDGTEKMAISRKDKSLGLLCQRFLAKYPENPLPQDRIEISLDEVAKDLSVERRRIYDIVNVLESVEVISRFAKNRYMWHGKTKLPQTLAKLKHYALTHGFTTKGGLTEKENPSSSKRTSNGKENPSSNSYSQIKGSKPGINDRYQQILPKNSKLYGSGMACLSSVFDSEEDEVMTWARKQKEADYCRKDKSLGVLSQKFLMMFLISDTKQVTLDDAANLLIDEQEEGKAKYKTKVRRLYDIANILSSLQLIQKVHIHNIQSGRKPGFRWIGMDLDKLEIQKKEPREPANSSKKAMVSKNSLVEKELEEESAFGRLISRRPSQQQLRHTKSDRGTKSKLPRSRSDRVLTCKKRVLSCDEENVQNNKEDGYSVQELIDLKGEATRSPDSVKFHSELMKLKEQYPDRMSQLLSACSTLQGLPVEDKKSRRTLFVSEAYIDAPMPKRRKSTEDSPSDDTNDKNGQFVHSFTSPFKPFNDKKSTDSKVDENSEDCGTLGLKQGSPEQKILLERKKQQKLLEEQKDFQLEDERWKRMEHELDKAFSKPEVPKSDSSLMFERSHPSVGIQANLIADVSPLKPLSHYVHSLQLPNPLKASQALYKAATSPPVNFQNTGVSPLVSNSVNSSTLSETPLAHISANDMPMSSKTVQNVKLVSLSSANLSSLWTMSSPRPIPTQPSIYHLTLPQQQVLSSTLCNPTTQAPVQSTSVLMSNPQQHILSSTLCNPTTQAPVQSTSVLMLNPQQQVLSSTLCNPTTQVPVQSTSVLMSNPQQHILSSTLCNPTTQAPVQSTSVLMSNPQQQVLSSTLCNPITQAPVQSTSVLMPNPQQPNHGFNNMIQVTSATLQPSVTLPMDIVSSLNTHGLVQNSPQDCKITRPIITVQQSLSQGFTPRMAMGPVSNIQGVQPIGATPILSKVMAQQMYSPMTTGTPGSNASFLHSEIAKKLVMPESRLTQS